MVDGETAPGSGRTGLAPDSQSATENVRLQSQPLSVFFAPTSVAVIGATETAASAGRTVLHNLVNYPFGGTVYPVVAGGSSVLGIRSYPSIVAIPGPVDLAIIATPTQTVPDMVAQCAGAGVKGVIILSAGFGECSSEGAKLETQIMDHARRARMRVLGPNCLGVMSPITGLNATVAGAMARPGNVAFISQSGALCTAVLDWSLHEMVGFSSFVSIGSMLDVGWGDLIDYFGDDPNTRSIVIYMESIGDARYFLSAAREVALTKPIIVIKAGRNRATSRTADAHAGATPGIDKIMDAAFRRCGVLRVNDLFDLFYMAEVLAKQPRPRGQRLAILTNAGGPGVLAADALIAGGGELAVLSPATLASLDPLLPEARSHDNPVNILGDATPERYGKALEILARDPHVDGLLVILAPQSMTDPARTAEQLIPYAASVAKPVLASWMGGAAVSAGERILTKGNIPTLPYPDAAARAFNYMWRYSYNLRALYETPIMTESLERKWDSAQVENLIQTVRRSGRTLLTAGESGRVLAAYGISMVETLVAANEEEALAAAKKIGFPVSLRSCTGRYLNPVDSDAVRYNLRDETSVSRSYREIGAADRSRTGAAVFTGVTVQSTAGGGGYELAIGSTLDAEFGPVLYFGPGGVQAQIYDDHGLALPPLNTTLARRLTEQTRIVKALKGEYGGRAVDISALERLLVQFSQLVVDQFWIREIEINPLLVSEAGAIVLDARIVVHGQEVSESSIPKPVIRPYPVQYSGQWQMRDGSILMIRPIRPEDEPLMVRFHETLSDRSVYFRYFHLLRLSSRIAHERLVRMCFIDYEREIALVAIRRDSGTSENECLGVGRIIRLHGCNDAEFAIVVGDRCQGQGLGTELLRRLMNVGRIERLDRIVGEILPDNRGMLRICERLGFSRGHSSESGAVRVKFGLQGP